MLPLLLPWPKVALHNAVVHVTIAILISLSLSSASFPQDGGGGGPLPGPGGGGGDGVEMSNMVSGSTSQLSQSPACQGEILRLCGRKPEILGDLDVLECVMNQKRNAVEELSDQCNDLLWHFRKSITEEQGFITLANRECHEDFGKLTECSNAGKQIVPCVIENKDKINNLRCQSLITRLESVIFSDFELISRFADKCQGDIERFKCGRNEFIPHPQRLPHTQGKTIECLSERIKDLTGNCAVEILRIAELQVDDFHLDRALYFSCRDDREKFCSRVRAGNGRVYKCLLKHKLEEEMTNECREQLYRRQKLGWQDYRASGIVSTCKNEIKKFKCRRDASSSDRNIRLSQILLCLENEAHKGHELNGDCVEEIKEHRRQLMEDYRVTPELLSACKQDKERFCAGEGLSGKTIHCLMSHAQKRHREDIVISDQCVVQLEALVRMSDPSGDWRVDPVLQQNCLPVVQKSNCDKVPANRVLDCLMNLLSSDTSIGTDNSVMSDKCEETLLQIQYFISRDFPMDSLLFDACHKDAKAICGAKDDWADDPGKMDPMRGPMVLSCLFRNINSYAPGAKLDPYCAERVRQTMRQRALSVRLIPEIESNCISDLSDLCSEKTKPGEELECLQDHLDELEKPCREAVGNFTVVEMKNPTVDPFIWRHCREIIENKCSEDKSDDKDVLECLIDLKNEMKSKKCRASVEHLQLLRLKDISFSPKFKAQCQESVIRFCNYKRPITAGSLVGCLSEIIRNDTVNDNTQRINKGCRRQVRYLVLSKIQLENEKADPNSIYAVCRDEIHTLCPQVVPGGGRILECLRNNEQKIIQSTPCHQKLFHVQQEVNIDPRVDVTLARECEQEIKYFCHAGVVNLVFCLRMNMNKEGFDMTRCGKVIRERLSEQNSDSRLSPSLHKSCKFDIVKFCGNVKPGEGRVIACLKDVFVDSSPKAKLTESCKEHIEGIIEGAAKVDIRLDGILYAACRSEIQMSCKNSGVENDEGDKGEAEECLKKLFRENKIHSTKCMSEVAQLIKSTMVDIHVDPLLNQACAMDLVRYCDNVPPGEGRLVACLSSKLEEERSSLKVHLLHPKCRELLSQRSELFRMAGSSSKLESIQDIVISVKESPSRNYFLIVAMSMVGCIFIFGLVCGRATKRRAMSKNK